MMLTLRSCWLGALVALAGCTSAETTGDSTADGRVVAEVAGRAITLDEVDARIQAMSGRRHDGAASEVDRARMIRQLVEEEALFRAAVDAGLDREPEIARRIAEFERQLLSQAFLDREQERVSAVDEAEARAFYESHLDEYRTERMLQVRLVVTSDSSMAVRAKEIADQGALRFFEIVPRFSDHPLVVANAGLVPEWIRRGRAIPWIGNHAAFHDAVFALDKHDVSDVIGTPVGWVVARVEDVREAHQRTFEEARYDVERRIVARRRQTGLPELLDSLKERYHARILEAPGRSAEELFQAAQAEASAKDRVALYEELVARFPEHERALESQFMIGFVRSEELRDSLGAQEAFAKVIEMAPDSELAGSARWMLSSGERELPESLQDSTPNAEVEP